jgi:TetR/AcrR family transcriptional repressor of nem operon
MADLQPDSKTRLLDATIASVREKGYAATRVDDICAAAGVSKGAFFHHFSSKDDVAEKAVAHWTSGAVAMFAQAPFNTIDDPVDRLFGYFAFRKSLLDRPLPEFTCYGGTLAQETYETHPAIRQALERSFDLHADWLATLVGDAMRSRGVKPAGWSADSLALHIQTVLQGAFVMAKIENSAAAAANGIDHLARYVALLLGMDEKRAAKPTTKRRGARAKAKTA